MSTCKEWQNPSLNSGLCPHLVEGGQAGQWSRTCGPLVWGLPEAPAHPLRLPALGQRAAHSYEPRQSSRWQVFVVLTSSQQSDPCAFFLGPLDCARTVAADEHHL